MNRRNVLDMLAKRAMAGLSLLVLLLVFVMFTGLYVRAKPILAANNLGGLLLSSSWHPSRGQFGLGGFIAGTMWVTCIALVVAVPLSVLTAVYISVYARPRARGRIKPVIDLLAGISPVIYGVWGVILIVPLTRDYLMPYFSGHFRFFPFSSENYTGYSVLAGGIVLGIMALPLIISIIEEVISSMPPEEREASLALGATKWETVKHVIFRKAKPGIIAAVILGLSRASGETMAVLMVAGCSLQQAPGSIFDTGYPLPALIANTYGEMMSIPLYDSAVMLAALILMFITIVFNAAGWGILLYLERNS